MKNESSSERTHCTFTLVKRHLAKGWNFTFCQKTSVSGRIALSHGRCLYDPSFRLYLAILWFLVVWHTDVSVDNLM
jgi:hypothetical protein